MKSFCIIINPTAGKGSAEKYVPRIEEFFKDQNISCEIHLTERVGHAAGLAAVHACSAVIAAGGDGTCNEVINGLMSRNPPRVLGVLPIGSGNDFSFGNGLPSDLEKCLEIIRRKKQKSIDAGIVRGGDYPDGRYFGNGIGIGFDTQVGLEVAKMKRIHGAAAYTLGALKTLWKYPEAPLLEITRGDEVEQISPALVSIMNGKRMGGAFMMAPDSANDDGLFNYCMTRQGRRGRLLRDMVHYLKGTQHTLNDTFTGMSSSFHIKALKGSMAVHADGELICSEGKELEVICIPSALSIFC